MSSDPEIIELLSHYPLVSSPSTVILILMISLMTIKLIQNQHQMPHQLNLVRFLNFNYDPILLVINGFFFGLFGLGIFIAIGLMFFGVDLFDCKSMSIDQLIHGSFTDAKQFTRHDVVIMTVKYAAYIFFILRILDFWRPLIVSMANQSTKTNQKLTKQELSSTNLLVRGKNVSNLNLINMCLQVIIILIGYHNHVSSVLFFYLLSEASVTCLTYAYYILKILNVQDKLVNDGGIEIAGKKGSKNKNNATATKGTNYRKILMYMRTISYLSTFIHGLYFSFDSNCGNFYTIQIHSLYFLLTGIISTMIMIKNNKSRID